MTLAIFVSVILSEIKCVEDFVRPLYIFVAELALFQAALLDLPPTAVLPLPAQERRRRHRIRHRHCGNDHLRRGFRSKATKFIV